MHDRIISHEEIIAEIDQVQLEDLEGKTEYSKIQYYLSSIGPIKNLESLDSSKKTQLNFLLTVWLVNQLDY